MLVCSGEMDLTRSVLRRLGARKQPKGLVLSVATRRDLSKVERVIDAKKEGRFLVLFSGPPGTGKAAAVASLRKRLGKPAFRVDCSKLLREYIGETEKNLSSVFRAASAKGAVLFFDEADALFGKRSLIRDRHDGYANQEVSYLLKRIKAYDGPVFFLSRDASNLKRLFLGMLDHVVEFRHGRVRRSL